MGYTHYWRLRPDEYDVTTWLRKVEDCKLIIATAIQYGLTLTDEFTDNQRVCFNGVGEAEHETMVIYRDPKFMRWVIEDRKKAGYSSPGFEFCKTAYKPYDKVVTACLCVLAEAGLEVTSDGDPQEWIEGLNFAAGALGRDVSCPIKERDAA